MKTFFFFFSSELLSGAVNRLGEDVLDVCPAMKDRDDEEEIQKNFCFVLADELERNGIISYHAKRRLDGGDLVLPLFASLKSTACLMLHLVEQNHGLEEEDEIDGGGGDANGEETRHVLNEEESEGEMETTASERRRWRQQETVIIYDRDNYSADDQFEEMTESSISEAPSKSTNLSPVTCMLKTAT